MFGFLWRQQSARHPRQEELSALIDGQLSPRGEGRVQRHLQQCPGCRRELATLRQTVHLLRSLPPLRAPRSFAIPLSAPAPALPAWARPGAYNGLRAATLAAAAFLVLALAGYRLALPAPPHATGWEAAAAPAAGEQQDRGKLLVEPAVPRGTGAPTPEMVGPALAAAAAASCDGCAERLAHGAGRAEQAFAASTAPAARHRIGQRSVSSSLSE